MKAILRLRGKICPSGILILVFVSCSAALAQEFAVHAAPATQAVSETSTLSTNLHEITPLKIGDKIPDELWEMYFPVVSPNSDQVLYLSLGDFKDKLIILDFWATWCGACISSLHKLDTLQQQFKDDLIVIPTSYEPENKIRPFLKDRAINLPSLIEEKELKNYFPYRSIPHQVWIKDGEIIGIGNTENLRASNISSIVAGENIKMFSIEEIPFDTNLPLLINGNGGTGENLLYQSMITTRIQADIQGKSMRIGDNQILIYNYTLANLFAEAFLYKLPPNERNKTRIIWEIPDSLRINFTAEGKEPTGVYEEDKAFYSWLQNNMYSYNLVYPGHLSNDEIYNYMQSDLNNVFRQYKSVNASIEKRMTQCIAVSLTDKYSSISTKGGMVIEVAENGKFTYVNRPFKSFIYSLANAFDRGYKLPVVDFTKIEGNVDMQLEISSLRNLDELNTALNKYGIQAVLEEREIDMLVIKHIL